MAATAAVMMAKRASEQAAGHISKILTGDLVTLHGQRFREIDMTVQVGKTKKGKPKYGTVKMMVPYEWELHLNPVSVMIGGIALTGAALFAALAWYGVKVPTLLGEVTVVRGLGDGIKDTYKNYKEKKAEKKAAKTETQAAQGSPGNPYEPGTWYYQLWESTH